MDQFDTPKKLPKKQKRIESEIIGEELKEIANKVKKVKISHDWKFVN